MPYFAQVWLISQMLPWCRVQMFFVLGVGGGKFTHHSLHCFFRNQAICGFKSTFWGTFAWTHPSSHPTKARAPCAQLQKGLESTCVAVPGTPGSPGRPVALVDVDSFGRFFWILAIVPRIRRNRNMDHETSTSSFCWWLEKLRQV